MCLRRSLRADEKPSQAARGLGYCRLPEGNSSLEIDLGKSLHAVLPDIHLAADGLARISVAAHPL